MSPRILRLFEGLEARPLDLTIRKRYSAAGEGDAWLGGTPSATWRWGAFVLLGEGYAAAGGAIGVTTGPRIVLDFVHPPQWEQR